MLKLRNSATSPYVRKVRVLLLETGLEDRVELIDTQVTPTNPNAELNVDNPIGKVPVLLTENGVALYDSPVICEYLDSLHSGTKMFPVNGVSRWLPLPSSEQRSSSSFSPIPFLNRFYSTPFIWPQMFFPDGLYLFPTYLFNAIHVFHSLPTGAVYFLCARNE